MSTVISTKRKVAPVPHELIRASAGTGKTYSLTRRYLTLLRRGVKPETILATTFTRKAAGEILGRVLLGLAQAALDDQQRTRLAEAVGDRHLSAAECQQMLAQLVSSLHRVAICTIDSFFGRVAGSFRHELGLPAEPALVTEADPIMCALRVQAIEALLGADEPATLVDLLRRLHHDQTKRSITDALDTIIRSIYETYRAAPQAEAWRQIDLPPRVSDDQVTQALAELDALASATFGAAITKALAKALACAEDGNWGAFLADGLPAAILYKGGKYGRQQLPDAVVNTLTPLIGHARYELLAGLAHRGAAMHELLGRFDEHYASLRQERGVLLFADITHKLARELPALGENVMTEVYYRLDSRVAHLLLDEFQDTSIEQWQVMAPLASEVAAHGDADAGERSFFCVGDVKQAIYGWRGGCSEIFSHIEAELYLTPEHCRTLSKSWRSSQIVLDTVNQVFGEFAANLVLEKHPAIQEQWSEGFDQHEAADPNKPGYVKLVTSPAGAETPAGEERSDDDDAPATQIDLHGEFVADRIAELAQQCAGRSIGVLVWTNEEAGKHLHLLRQRQVPASGEGGNTITDDPAVGAVLAALTLGDHPGHTAAGFHVLHSPLKEILELGSMGAAELGRVAATIRRRVVDEGYAATIADWARALAPCCDQRSVIRLTQLIELADTYQRCATLRPRDFVAYVEAQRVEEAMLAPVRVMTVHAAKGLEFDIVVLPQLNRKIGEASRLPVLTIRDGVTGPILAVFPNANKELRALCAPLEAAHEQAVLRRLQDDLCALYVAMTRARYALHMFVTPLDARKNGEASSVGWSNLQVDSLLRQALAAEPRLGGGETLYAVGDPQWHAKLGGNETAPAAEEAEPVVLPDIARVAQRVRLYRQVLPSQLVQSRKLRVADLLGLGEQTGRRRGTLLHALFQCVQWLDESPLPDDAALRECLAKLCPEEPAASVDAAIQRFRLALQQPAIAAALRRPALDDGVEVSLWRERPIAARVGDELVRGVVDRATIFRRHGRAVAAHLVDFKSDTITPAEAPALLEHYRPQLRKYRQAVAAMLNLPEEKVTAELLFLEAAVRASL